MKINNIYKFLLVGLIAITISFSACKDEDEESTGNLPTATEIVTPNPECKPGDLITVKGAGLDQISQIRIGESVLVDRKNFKSATDNEIAFALPSIAISGDVFLIVKDNTKPNVYVGELNIKTPVITLVSPLEIFSGDMLTITGTDLDMITSVKIEDESAQDIEITGTTSIKAVFSYSLSKGGVLKVSTINGQEIAYSIPITVKKLPATPTITEVLPLSIKPGQALTIRGKNLDQVEKILFEEGLEVTSFEMQNEGVIEVVVPSDAKKGTVTITLVTIYEDTASTTINIASDVDPIIDPALVLYGFEDGLLGYALWDGVGKASTANGVSGTYYEISASTWTAGKYWLFAENHIEHASVPNKAEYWLKMDVCLRQNIPAANAQIRLLITGIAVDILPYLLNEDDTQWSTNEDWKTIAIPLTQWSGLAEPTPTKGSDWGMTIWDNGTNFTGFCVDNIRYEKR